ncbi:MAG: T9SS type A sorting domain-containing protein [Ignavibacteria bacterium]|nr:T9SS type A sorting domain-containing protein [Ignavibacteria bacterium]
MRKIIFTAIIICMSFQIAEAQWIKQYQNTTSVGLHDVKFINETTGWACGDGIILKTTNAGTEWVAQPHLATNKALYSISPVDSLIVYCAGFFETILKTTNGGTTWDTLRNGPFGQGTSYEGTFFLNKDTGWICGSLGAILKTTNGGVSFEYNPIFWGYTKDMYFINADTGLICGAFGGMFKTTNGGLNWSRKTIPYWNGIGDFRKLSVINNQYVFVGEDGRRVFKSTNFGDTWDSIGYIAGANQPYVCRFSSLNTGWVGGTFGELYKSTDAGATWRRENTNGDIRYIGAMYFLSDSVGWVVGGNTKIFYTTTGGLTFIKNENSGIINHYKLHQNYPNPFNPMTMIKYDLPNDNFVMIKIYDILGKELLNLVNEFKQAGSYTVTFDATNYPSGVYYYKIKTGSHSGAGSFVQVRKMILIK